MKIRVGIAFDVREADTVPDPDELAAHLARVMDALIELDNIIDPDVSATLSEGHVEVSLIVDAEDDLAAAQEGVVAVRTAIHSAGGSARWSTADGHTRVRTERFELTPA